MLKFVLEPGAKIIRAEDTPESFQFDLNIDALKTQIKLLLGDGNLDKSKLPEYQQLDRDLQVVLTLVEEVRHFMTQTNPVDFVIEATKKCQRVEALCRKLAKCGLENHEDRSQLGFITKNIIEASVSLRQQLSKALLNMKTQNEPRILESYALFCEQWLLSQHDTAFKEIFESTLKLVGQYVEKERGWRPSVFISYAWPSIQNKSKEFWLQTFLARLHQHLYLAGCDVVLDIIDCKFGQNIYRFMEQAETSEKVVLVCTSTLKDKHLYGKSAVATELNHIRVKRRLDEELSEENVIPISLAGIFGENFPAEFEKYTNIAEWRGRSYIKNLISLICTLMNANHTQAEAIKALCKPLTASLYNEPMSKAEAQKTMCAAEAELRKFEQQNAQEYNQLLTELVVTTPSATKANDLCVLATQLRENPVVFITDPGGDDLGMLGMGLSPNKGFKNILGIVAATGNVSLHNVKYNILGMLKLTDRQKIPVYEGCNQKLTPGYEIPDGSKIFSKKGISQSGRVMLPEITSDDLARVNPLQDLIKVIASLDQKVTLVSTAGLTDVSIILSALGDKVKDKIAGISIMGGAFTRENGNAPLNIPLHERVCEFNFCWDPDATKNVFNLCAAHDIPIVIAATDITHHFGVFGLRQTEMLRTLTNNPVATFLADLIDDSPDCYKQGRYSGQEKNFPMHDLFAVMCLLDPENFTFERVHLQCAGGKDSNPGRSTKTTSFTGCVLNLTSVIDENRFYQCYLDAVRGFKRELVHSPRSSRTLLQSGSPLHSPRSHYADEGSLGSVRSNSNIQNRNI